MSDGRRSRSIGRCSFLRREVLMKSTLQPVKFTVIHQSCCIAKGDVRVDSSSGPLEAGFTQTSTAPTFAVAHWSIAYVELLPRNAPTLSPFRIPICSSPRDRASTFVPSSS